MFCISIILIIFRPLRTSYKVNNSSSSSNNFRHTQKLMENRLKRIKETCTAYSTPPRKHNLPKNDLLIDYEHKIGYCRHGKVATSSILSYFLMINSKLSSMTKYKWKDNIDALHENLNSFFPGQKKFHTLKDLVDHVRERKIVTFSFVRHPFERLVSAFENKIKYPPRQGKYNDLSRKLEANFTYFVDFVLRSGRKCKMGSSCQEVDVHWRPYHARCAYCDIPYDVIGKVETFPRDFRYLQSLSRLGKKGTFQPETLNAVPHHADRGKRYFESLDYKRRHDLYKMYKPDFDLFGYEAKSYGIEVD